MIPTTEKQQFALDDFTLFGRGVGEKTKIGKSDISLADAVPAEFPHIGLAVKTVITAHITVIHNWETIDKCAGIDKGTIVAVVHKIRHGTCVGRLPVFVLAEIPARVILLADNHGNSVVQLLDKALKIAEILIGLGLVDIALGGFVEIVGTRCGEHDGRQSQEQT